MDVGTAMTADQRPSIEGDLSREHRGIEVHIEALVLHGFQPGDRHRIGVALERELSRLLAERGLPVDIARPLEIPHLDASALGVTHGAAAEAIGSQIARALYRGLSP